MMLKSVMLPGNNGLCKAAPDTRGIPLCTTRTFSASAFSSRPAVSAVFRKPNLLYHIRRMGARFSFSRNAKRGRSISYRSPLPETEYYRITRTRPPSPTASITAATSSAPAIRISPSTECFRALAAQAKSICRCRSELSAAFSAISFASV